MNFQIEESGKLSKKEQNKNLFESQKALLDTFLKNGAITKAQYEKSLCGLKEKMGIEE